MNVSRERLGNVYSIDVDLLQCFWHSIAWRKAREEWDREMVVKSKLIMLKKITNLDE